MKSIKEKAEEYANEQDLRMAYNGSCDNYLQGFEAGANYVLECIEEATNICFDEELKNVIQQLKK